MKKTILLALLLVTVVSYGQRKYAADRYFKEFAYVKSIELYEKIYEKGDDSFLVLSRLADANYFNNNTKASEKWYRELFDRGLEATPEHYFRYAQSLKSNGNHKESDQWMLKLEQLKGGDSRVASILANEDYYSEYSKEAGDFVNINNVSTNTEYSDYGVHITEEGLLFSSTRSKGDGGKLYKWNNQPFLNLYTVNSTIISSEPDGLNVLELENPKKLEGDNINTKYHEASAVVTKDGNTMYFTRDNYDGKKLRTDKGRTSHLKIYKTTKENGSWGKAVELPFNSDLYSSGQPALSQDDKTLYFVSDMPGGKGGTDLYKVSVLGDDNYGSPENLGGVVNTEGKEMFPVISKEGVLYFSSNGHIGLGGLDVFKSKISGNNFTSPLNLGAPVNSYRDDFSLVFMKDGKSGFFSSNREGGKGDDDIYSFMLYSCDEFMDGIVYDANTEEVIVGATVKLIDEEGKILQTQTTDDKGYYNFGEVACSKKYTVLGEKMDYKSDLKEVVTQTEDQFVINTDLHLTSLIVKGDGSSASTGAEDQIVINPIYFDFDLYNIREDAEYELEHIVTVMTNHPEMVIRIESHTDSRGTHAYNRTLSDNRAKSTRDYLYSRGIARERIQSAVGFGESRLLNHCDDANQKKCSKAEHQLNRRSYFYIVKGNNVRSSNE